MPIAQLPPILSGYGVTSLALKIDGNVVKSTTQACSSGGCSASLIGTINMANYKGGAHPAQVIATDLAGNTSSKNWTINVDPKGTISVPEAVDTLKALEGTSPPMS